MNYTQEELEKIIELIDEQIVVLTDEQKNLEEASKQLHSTLERVMRNKEVFLSLLDLELMIKDRAEVKQSIG